MPNPTITASSYAGEFAVKYLGAALLSASTLDAGAVTILPNIKYKAAMKVGAFSNLVRSADCDFDATTSGLTLTEKVLTPTELQFVQFAWRFFCNDRPRVPRVDILEAEPTRPAHLQANHLGAAAGGLLPVV